MTYQKFKRMVKMHGGHYEKERDYAVGWWDAYGSKDQMFFCYGRLYEITKIEGGRIDLISSNRLMLTLPK